MSCSLYYFLFIKKLKDNIKISVVHFINKNKN